VFIRRFASLLLIFAGPGWSQFTELATTDDAQHLYFTSQLRLSANAAATPEYRVFHFGPAGAELFAERSPMPPPNNMATITSGSGDRDGVDGPQVSGDGSLIGVTSHYDCSSGSSCTPAEGLLRGARVADLGPGNLQLSRNGRWAVLTQYVFQSDIGTLIDLQTNQSVSIPSPLSVASNGDVLVRQTSPSGGVAVGIWRQGQFSPLSLAGAIASLTLSDDAATIVYIRRAPGSARSGVSLIARNLLSGRETTLYASDTLLPVPNFLGMTNDGKQALYSVWSGEYAGPAYLSNTSTGISTELVLDAGELATAGTLSGSGNAAYLATSHGRIVKFLLSGGVPGPPDTVVPKTPYIDHAFQYQPGFSPGSMVRLHGVLPDSVDQLSGGILLDGNPIPVLYASSNEVRVQIPWEQKIGETGLALNLAGSSPFQQNDLVTVASIAPNFERADPTQQTILGLLIKGDFSGTLTTPPGPGDIVNVYFTGLGAVNGQIQTGVPTPIDTTFPISGQLTCQLLPQQSPMETLFVGLAPLMIGIYQASFRMPDDASGAPVMGLDCSLVSKSGSASFGVYSGGLP
jgi:uncharacterized protein (TIGR03437 family)